MNSSIQLNWLTESFVRTVLKEDLKVEESDLVITKYAANTAIGTGENFSSHIYRLSADYTYNKIDYNKSFIVKVLLDKNSEIGKMHKEMLLFEKEVHMYQTVLPKVTKMLSTIYPNFKISPKLIHVISEPEEIIVLEDLKPSGYKLEDKKIGLNYVQCKLALEKLAKYHAISMLLNKQDPEYRKLYNKGFFYEGMSEGMCDYVRNGVIQATKLMKSLPECSKYVQFYEKFLNSFIKNGIKNGKTVPANVDEFFVLNHGDFWIQNLMFKNDSNGEAEDVLVLDWQVTRFMNPGNDINYFFFTSVIDECRNRHRDDLLESYISTLRKVLTELNCPGFIPTLDDLNASLYQDKDIAIMTPCIVLPLVKIESDDKEMMTTEGIMDSEESESRNALYNNKSYQKALIEALRHLEKIKFIETS